MLSRLDFFAFFFFYVTGAWDRLKVFEVHVLVSPKVRRGRQGLRRNSPGRPHQHGKPEKRKRENPLRSARPCGRTSLEGFRNLPRRFGGGGGGGASPTPTGLPDLNRSADQPINRTNEKCFRGGTLGVDTRLHFSDGHVGSKA